jgi:pyruvate ferredoxin oxidoreductase beta subunit
MEVSSTIYPYTSWATPWLHTAFETAGSNASGIEAALKILRKKGRIKDQQVDVIAFAGDGGTYDIGIQALSGAVERGHDFMFVLYDNEAYMNTGIQRSGGTPYGASTTTSQAGSAVPGKLEQKKPIADIMVAHDMPYVATASPYYWKDLIMKARKGIEVNGPAFLHVFAPCPRGWRSEPSKSIELSKLAVETCIFPLWEAVNGDYQLSTPSKVIALAPQKKKPVKEYLQVQGRFRHLFAPKYEKMLEQIQNITDEKWSRLLKKCGIATPAQSK